MKKQVRKFYIIVDNKTSFILNCEGRKLQSEITKKIGINWIEAIYTMIDGRQGKLFNR